MSSASQSNGSRQNLDNEHIAAPGLLTSLEWRCVGPYRGGRVVAVAGDPSHSHTFKLRSAAAPNSRCRIGQSPFPLLAVGIEPKVGVKYVGPPGPMPYPAVIFYPCA